jgi:hypothetical protein
MVSIVITTGSDYKPLNNSADMPSKSIMQEE